jgi:hypothetical protein
MAWSGRSEADIIADFIRMTEADLRRVLPPAADKHTARSERLKITSERPAGGSIEVRVVAVGDFNASSARAFAAVARNQRGNPRIRVITVMIYSDATSPRTPVATYGENLARVIQRTLREKLPPAGPTDTGLPFAINVVPNIEGLVDAYNVSASGPFTSENAAAFVGAIQALQKTLPGETRLFGVVSSNATHTYTVLEKFDTGAGK